MSRRGSIINGDLAKLRMLLGQGLQSPAAEAYVHDGDVLLGMLAHAVHAGEAPSPDVEQQTRGFMRFSGLTFGTAAFGKRLRESGYSSDETIAAMRSGEWDPWADVELPR